VDRRWLPALALASPVLAGSAIAAVIAFALGLWQLFFLAPFAVVLGFVLVAMDLSR